ncbi:MAG TPA: Nif3-like dinuclear metal center hexameric protein, partial [Solirubrobacterales bacterium]|nr:Nif3-like dinuclear metal center hexameric protein [Solirubrobacterales bacterium]
MARRDEIVAFCDQLLDTGSWEDYGPNGLQMPGRSEVSKLVSGVSAHRELLERAVEAGAQLVLVHHGLFWDSQPRALSAQMAGRLRIAFDGELSVAAYHLPLDAHREIGNNALLCERLGFDLDPQPFAEIKSQPIGAVGRSDRGIEPPELLRRVEATCDREPLVFDFGPDRVRSIGIVSGAGAAEIHAAMELGLDAFLTGEPAEHAMADAREGGIHFIAAGHYATETLGIRRLGE